MQSVSMDAFAYQFYIASENKEKQKIETMSSFQVQPPNLIFSPKRAN